MKILFVEDSALLRRAMVKAAAERGFKTAEAENGAEALSRLREMGTSIDVIVMDWNMPVLDGFEALQKIRSMSEYDDIPVLMATSDGVQEDVVAAIKAGAAGYLIKPFTPDALVDKISEILGYRPEMQK